MKEQLEREKKVLEYFIEHPTAYIREIAEKTGIPKSSVQRYLQKYAKFRLENGLTIEEQLQKNQDQGRKKGGITYYQNNEPTREENGRFTGSEAASCEQDKNELKKRDIIFFCDYYLEHYPITFKEMAEDLKELEKVGVTKGYIYHCVTANDLENIIGADKAEEVHRRLEASRYSFDKKAGKKVEDLPIELSPREAMVAGLRRDNHSQEQVGRIIGVSKGTIQKWEKRAIEKMKGVKRQ